MNTAMQKLTDAEFAKYPVYTMPQADGLWANLEYYRLGNTLGVVALDNVDHDFAAVVLQEDPERKLWRGVNVRCSLPTIEVAREALEDMMREAEAAGEIGFGEPPIAETHPEIAEVIGAVVDAWSDGRRERCRKHGS